MTAERWDDQRTPALAIVARGDQITRLSAFHFRVKSQSNPDRLYGVSLVRGQWECGCDHFRRTKLPCIHVHAVRLVEGFRERLARQDHADVPATPRCDACQSENVCRNGKRHNASGSRQRWLCRDCGQRFMGPDGFHKQRQDPKTIAVALDLYYRGLSLRKVADHLYQAYGVKVNHTTILAWIRRFTRLAQEYVDTLKPEVGQRWHMDEMVLNVNGAGEYLYNLMDADTRFLLATHLAKTRTMADTREPLKRAKALTDTKPSEVFTDGMNAYPVAVSMEYGTVGGVGGRQHPHRRVPSIRAAESNNLVERFHGTTREREKVMRALDGHESGDALMQGWRIHYNFARPHMALDGLTPAEAAGLPSLGDFKWLELLKKAARHPIDNAEEGK